MPMRLSAAMLCWIMSATKNPALLSSAAWLGLFAQRMALGAYYTAGETQRAVCRVVLGWR